MSGQPPLPLYQAFRQVRACRIKAIERTADGWMVHPHEPFIDPFKVPAAFVSSQQPIPNGYLVVKHNGFMKFVLAADFETDYFQVDHLKDRRAQLVEQLADVDEAISLNSAQVMERNTP